MTFGERVQLALAKRATTQAELARAIGHKPATLNHWLTGRRQCPPEVVDQIAATLRVSRGWLRSGREQPTSSEATMPSRRAPQNAALTSDLRWYFRHAPQDGGRDFGNANTYATPPDIPTFVRELGQNSTDAAYRVGGAALPVTMRFSLIELTRGSEQYDRFLSASHLDEVEAHINEAVTVAGSRSKLAARLRDGIRSLRGDERLVLLRVDDYGTVGLHGDELSDQNAGDDLRSSPYAALVRNNLDSSKEATTAGGAYGLGKAVLWNCSGVSTVLFASRVPQFDLLRTTGRTELTWHRLEGDAFAGPGWFGLPEYGSSLWTEDEQLLRDLQLNRDDRLPSGVDRRVSHGTSALVVAFRDPQGEGADDVADILKRLEWAVAENFFPAILGKKLRVFVEHLVDGDLRSQAEVIPASVVPEFCDALRAHLEDELVEELSEVGTTTRRSVPLRVPPTRPDAQGVDEYGENAATAHLLVRLDEDPADGSPAKLTNRVAFVRGRGMVVEYWAREGVAMGAKPFHAILLAGEAVSSETGQRAAEQFLRLSEPPAHNKWEYSPEVKAAYKLGAKRELENFRKAITEELRRAIQPQSGGEAEGPEELKRLLNFGSVTDPGTPLATLRNIRAQLSGGRWAIEAEIHFNEKAKRMRVAPRAWIDVESGAAIPLAWATLTYRRGREELGSEDGAVLVGPGARTLHFSGTTVDQVDGIRAAICRARVDLYADVIGVGRAEARNAA